jgi:hypothetical protein
MKDQTNEKEIRKENLDPRLLILLELGEEEEFDQDEQAFMLGLLETNELITHDLKLTEAGIKEYQEMLEELEYENSEDDEDINDDK